MIVKVYGSRGSLPTTREKASRYGSNTTCIAIETPTQSIILDAGGGLAQIDRITKLFAQSDKSFDILLSHLHIDHIIGLTIFSKVWVSSPDNLLRIYTANRDDRPLKEQVFGAFVPPYWPLAMETIAHIECVEVFDSVSFKLGHLTITPFYASHPNKTTSFHVTDGKKTVVHLLDNEVELMGEKQYETLVNYCKNADVVVFDAAYTNDEYEVKRGWGHSTVAHGVKLANICNCERMLFSHFSPGYSDQQLDALIAYLIPHGYGNRFMLCNDGLEIEI